MALGLFGGGFLFLGRFGLGVLERLSQGELSFSGRAGVFLFTGYAVALCGLSEHLPLVPNHELGRQNYVALCGLNPCGVQLHHGNSTIPGSCLAIGYDDCFHRDVQLHQKPDDDVFYSWVAVPRVH